jgi:molybdenum cofactor biosynthesis enzyme MoaA
MNDADFPVSDVLEGLAAAHAVGLESIKINMVVKGGLNDQEIVPMARYFKDSPFILRFIEYMDVGASNGWKMNEVILRRSRQTHFGGDAAAMISAERQRYRRTLALPDGVVKLA